MAINRPAHTRPYRIFLLTFWLEDADDLADPETWRFRLEEPRFQRLKGCVGFATLVALLKDEIADKSVSKDE